jgi:hypothetical protein
MLRLADFMEIRKRQQDGLSVSERAQRLEMDRQDDAEVFASGVT